MLGSLTEADDAVQEAWLRLSRSDTSDVANLGGWLTTVVARVCLDMLRSRKTRREGQFGVHVPADVAGRADPIDLEREALLADSVGPALLVVLETLTPAERVAFVLHDMFDVSFSEIARIVGRSEAAVRQLASRARRRVKGATTVADADRVRQRHVVDAFLSASREGNFDALLAVLDPNVVLRADEAAVAAGATGEVRGAAAVAETFKGRARAARPALVGGAAGAAWVAGGEVRAAFGFTVADGKIVAIDVHTGARRLSQLEVVILKD